jgi:hypothetical protein
MNNLESQSIDPTLIVAVFSLLGSILANIIQFVKIKGENKKLNAESSTILIETALKINQQEVATLRIFNEDIDKRYKELVLENRELKEENKRLREELEKRDA